MLRVEGLKFRLSGSRCRVQGEEFRVSGFGCQVSGFGCRVPGSGFRVPGSRFWVPDPGVGCGVTVSNSGLGGARSARGILLLLLVLLLLIQRHVILFQKPVTEIQNRITLVKVNTGEWHRS